jgi:hypothetical protein
MRTVIVIGVAAIAMPIIAFAGSDDPAWYLVRGNSGTCSRFDADPTTFTKLMQQQPGGVLNNGDGGSISEKSEVPGVIERVPDDGKGHVAGMVFVQGADDCRRIAETMRATHLMPFQQRAQSLRQSSPIP